MKKITTIKLVMTALFIALTMVGTMFITVPLPTGYANLGDAFVLIAVFVLGPFWGTIAGGVGSGLADLFGWITYAPGTLIIKSLMAITAYFIYIALKKSTKKEMLAQIIAGAVGAVVMAVGYFIYETIFFVTAGVAIVSLPYNLIQGSLGVVVAVMVMRVLKATKIFEKLDKTNNENITEGYEKEIDN